MQSASFLKLQFIIGNLQANPAEVFLVLSLLNSFIKMMNDKKEYNPAKVTQKHIIVFNTGDSRTLLIDSQKTSSRSENEREEPAKIKVFQIYVIDIYLIPAFLIYKKKTNKVMYFR